MLPTLLFDAAGLFALLHVAAPVALRQTFRFTAHCRPQPIPLEELEQEAAECILRVMPDLESLGFEFLGCYDLGEVTAHTRKIAGYFCDRETQDYAAVVISCAGAIDAYIEFSTSFSNGETIETNNNGVLPLTPDAEHSRVFRFGELNDTSELHHLHRCLVAKYAVGLSPAAEPKAREIYRLARAIDNYGPRHARIGYMKLSRDSESYELTWKGAALMAWRALWPAALVREFALRQAMRAERHVLESDGAATLQKA